MLQEALHSYQSNKHKMKEQKKEEKNKIEEKLSLQEIKSSEKDNEKINYETKKEEKEPQKSIMKLETKKEEKRKKNFAAATGKDLPLSTKDSTAICRFIKYKDPYLVIKILERVIQKKQAIPVIGEAGHKPNLKGGFAKGRFFIKASKYFIKIIKSLISNAKNNGLDQDNLIITLAKANKASEPIRGTRIAFGKKRFKRTHIYLEVREKKEINTKKIKEKTSKKIEIK